MEYLRWASRPTAAAMTSEFHSLCWIEQSSAHCGTEDSSGTHLSTGRKKRKLDWGKAMACISICAQFPCIIESVRLRSLQLQTRSRSPPFTHHFFDFNWFGGYHKTNEKSLHRKCKETNDLKWSISPELFFLHTFVLGETEWHEDKRHIQSWQPGHYQHKYFSHFLQAERQKDAICCSA